MSVYIWLQLIVGQRGNSHKEEVYCTEAPLDYRRRQLPIKLEVCWLMIKRHEKETKREKRPKRKRGKEGKKEEKGKEEKKGGRKPEMSKKVQRAISVNNDPSVWQFSFIFRRFISLKLP